MLVVLMGKSACGKDTVLKKLLQDEELELKPIVGYTTRPRRKGEKDGREYFFVTKKKMVEMTMNHEIAERRTYQTALGTWDYFTADDGQAQDGNHVMIGTPDSCKSLLKRFPDVLPVLIESDDAQRLLRAVSREMQQDNPNYMEVCRRFLADEGDFKDVPEEWARFYNTNLCETVSKIKDYILSSLEETYG